MYTVYGAPRNRTMRVLWALEELEAPYQFVAAQPRTPEIAARNPSGKVPVLEVDGVALTDSVAIVQYLADKHGKLTHPAGTIERARQDGATQFCVDEIEGALWTFAKHKFVLPEDLRLADIRPACLHDFAKAMTSLEARLGDKPFITGDTFRVPDIIIGHCALWADVAKFDRPSSPTVNAYFERITSRPALARAKERNS